jgi:phage-related protein
MESPNNVVNGVLDGLANGVKGAVNGVLGAFQGVGKTVVNGLDKPFYAITKKQGPLHIVDRAADGVKNGTENFIDNGIIGSLQDVGHGINNALQHPIDQIAGGIKMPFGKK